MSNSYYNHTSGTPVANSRGLSSNVRSEFDSIAAGFDAAEVEIDLKAPIASPTFTGTPIAPTAAAGTDTTQIATTAFSMHMDSPAFVGTPTAPTAAGGTNTAQIATTAFVAAQAFSAALPAQAGNNGKFVTTDGVAASWADIPSMTPATQAEMEAGAVTDPRSMTPLNIRQAINALFGGAIGDTLTTARTMAAPTWLPCNGSIYLRSSYSALYALLGDIADRPDLIVATAQTLPATQTWTGLAYGNNVWAAIGGEGVTSTAAASSANGQTWTARTIPSGYWYGVVFGGSSFVAVGSGTNCVATSPDAITWTQRTIGNRTWRAVAFGGGTFCAVASVSAVAATSADGQTWVERTLPASRQWFAITHGNGVFVAVADGSDKCATSPDGVTWTERTMPSSQAWRGVAYGNGVFLAVSIDGVCATSPDGVTWTKVGAPPASYRGLAFGGGLFLAVSSSPSTIAYITRDGFQWQEVTMPSAQVWSEAGYGNGTFVATAAAANAAISMPDGITYNRSTQFATQTVSVGQGANTYIRAQ